jgi:ornithine--oxo-acid transaminase
VLADSKIMNVWDLGTHSCSFSGNPLGSAVAVRSLEVMIEKNIIERSRSNGQYVLRELKKMQPDRVREIRGRVCDLVLSQELTVGSLIWMLCLLF